MSVIAPVYITSLQNGVLRQGEIISNLPHIVAKLETIGTEKEDSERIVYDFAIVVSQDCDLTQDYNAKIAGERPNRWLDNILFCQAEISDSVFYASRNPKATEADKARAKEFNSNTAVQKVQQNTDFRFHYLRKIESVDDALGTGISPLVIDFSKTFSIPRDEVYKRFELNTANRRTVLNSPYLEHLAVRFHHFHCRVALPLDHHHDLPVSPPT